MIDTASIASYNGFILEYRKMSGKTSKSCMYFNVFKKHCMGIDVCVCGCRVTTINLLDALA